jgi:hypothetical protein
MLVSEHDQKPWAFDEAHGISRMVRGTLGGRRMCLRDAPEQGCNGLSAGAAEHAWRALTFPLAPSSPRGERKGGRGGWRERTLATPHAMVAQARYVPTEKSGFLIRLSGAYRRGRGGNPLLPCTDSAHHQARPRLVMRSDGTYARLRRRPAGPRWEPAPPAHLCFYICKRVRT